MLKRSELGVIRHALLRELGREYGPDIGENRTARAACDSILRQEPGRALSKADRARIEDYARTVLGSRHYAPWLEFYTIFHGRFREGWISENYIERHYSAKVSGAFRAFGSRTASARLLRTDALPDIAYRIQGRYYDADWEPIPEDRVLATVFADHPRVVLKRDFTFRGSAVSFVDRETFEARAAASPSDFSVQRPLRQHDFFADLSPTAAATLRLSSVRGADGKERVLASYLRLGTSGAEVVNPDHTVRVAVDRDSGTTTGWGYGTGWRRTPVHPDTGAPLEGRALPQFAEAVALVEGLHARMPHIPYIGWDLCITQDEGPKLFEVNANRPGSSLAQAHFGPIFAGTGLDRLHIPRGPATGGR